MKIALLIVHTKTFFPRMLELGKALRKHGQYEPVFYLAYTDSWVNIQDDVNLLELQEFKVLGLDDQQKSPRAYQPYKGNKYIKALHRMISKSFVVRLVNDVRYINHRLGLVKEIINKYKVSIIVLSIDIPTWDTAVYIKAAHQQGIPAVFSLSCTRLSEESLEVYSNMAELSTKLWDNWLMSKFYPRWQANYKGKSFLMIDGQKVFVREILKLAPPLPWVEGSSNADAVLSENQKFYQEGLSVGITQEKIFLTGQTVHDDMFRVLSHANQLRQELYQNLGFSQDKPMILTSLIPPYGGRVRPDTHFKSHADFIEFWIKTLAAFKDHNVVVSLHPSMLLEEYRFLEQWGVKLSSMSIAHLMPLCSIFVTSVSSTMSYAMACGKPVVNFDALLYRNTMFKEENAIITVEDKEEFVAVMHKLIEDKKYYDQVARDQESFSGRWGLLDGKACDRIVGVFDQLCERYHVHR